MKPCTPAFPVSIGDRVFSQRLGRAGDVVALQVSEKVGPKAKIEYLNKEGDLKYAWIFCDTLRDPKGSRSHHEMPPALDLATLPGRRFISPYSLSTENPLTALIKPDDESQQS